jgi:hypothetical protein
MYPSGDCRASLANQGWLFGGGLPLSSLLSLLSPVSSDFETESSELNPSSSDSKSSGSE